MWLQLIKTVWFRLYGQVSRNFTKTVFLLIWTNVAKQSVLANFGQFEQNQRVFLFFWSMWLKLMKRIGFLKVWRYFSIQAKPRRFH